MILLFPLLGGQARGAEVPPVAAAARMACCCFIILSDLSAAAACFEGRPAGCKVKETIREGMDELFTLHLRIFYGPRRSATPQWISERLIVCSSFLRVTTLPPEWVRGGSGRRLVDACCEGWRCGFQPSRDRCRMAVVLVLGTCAPWPPHQHYKQERGDSLASSGTRSKLQDQVSVSTWHLGAAA